MVAMVVVVAMATVLVGCAGHADPPPRAVYQSGPTTVQLERDPESSANSHPVQLTPSEVGTLLRGVRVWDRRNFLQRLFAGEADKMRAFRDDEIARLAPALTSALAEATREERVYFRLSRPTDDGLEEVTTGWISVRDPLMHLSFRDVHHTRGPMPEISKYDRQMPDIPETSTPFNVMFEPEEFVAATRTIGAFYAPDQREEVEIRYRPALSVMPSYPITGVR